MFGGVSLSRSTSIVNSTDQVVRLNDALNVFAVNADCYSHEEMLGTLSYLAIDAEQVRSLKGLVAKVVLLRGSIHA